MLIILNKVIRMGLHEFNSIWNIKFKYWSLRQMSLYIHGVCCVDCFNSWLESSNVTLAENTVSLEPFQNYTYTEHQVNYSGRLGHHHQKYKNMPYQTGLTRWVVNQNINSYDASKISLS